MTFAFPLLLVSLFLFVPMVAAYLFRRRRTSIRVPSVMLWRRIGETKAPNRRLRSLVRLASLLACLCALLGLSVAAADPMFSAPGETVAIVVDVSASMARDNGAPMAEAREYLARELRLRNVNDQYVLIAAGEEPVCLAGPTNDAAILQEGLSRLQVSLGAPDLGSAVDRAGDLLVNLPTPRIVLVTDEGQGLGPAIGDARGVDLTIHRVGADSDGNVGITSFSTRPPDDAAHADELVATAALASSFDSPVSVELTLSADDVVIDRRQVQLEPGVESTETFRLQTIASTLAVTLTIEEGTIDVLALDDRAELLVQARVEPRVVIIATPREDDPTPFFVSQAVLAAGHELPEILSPEEALAFSPEGDRPLVWVSIGAPPESLSGPVLVVEDGSRNTDRFVFTPIEAALTRLRSVDSSDPVLRGVDLDDLTVYRAFALSLPEGARSLVALDGGDVVARGGAGEGEWIYLGIDPARSDLVLRVAFPVLVANALSQLSGRHNVTVAAAVDRAEVELRQDAEIFVDIPEAERGFRLPFNPVFVFVLLAALLLAGELWTYKKGWV